MLPISTDIVLEIEGRPTLLGPKGLGAQSNIILMGGVRQASPLPDADLSNMLDISISCPLDIGNNVDDSLFIEGYSPPPATYAGRQRNGIRQSIVNIESVEDHINQAGRLPSKFSEPTPFHWAFGDRLNLSIPIPTKKF